MSSKRRPASGRQRRGQRVPVRIPWWKRPLVWIGGLVTAIAVGAAGAFGTGLGQGLFSGFQHAVAPAADHRKEPVGPPVKFTIGNVGLNEGSFVLPRPVALTTPQLNSLNAEALTRNPNYAKWFFSRGGAYLNVMDFLLVVKGNRYDKLRIINIAPSEHCIAPLNGTEFLYENAGEESNRTLDFNLDSPQVPASYKYNDRPIPNYFSKYSVSLSYGEQYTFHIQGSVTQQHTCDVTFKMTVLEGSNTVIESISNDGKPFRVTSGLFKGSRRGSLSIYHDLYVGGILLGPISVKPETWWVRVNPKIYDPLCPSIVECRRSVLSRSVLK